MKLVSVVVATYRREKELKGALESLASQTYSNLEVILVDDNASDRWNQAVLRIVEEFRTLYPNVVIKLIVNGANEGSAKTRNIGIEAATGFYITFLDDDDVYLPDKIKKQVQFMEDGKYDYSITDLVLYNADGKEIDKRTRAYINDTSVPALRMYHLKYHMTGTDTMMFRKAYLTKIGGFAPINVGDEFYLMQRAIEGEGRFGYLPGCEIKAYVHTGEGGLSSGEGKIKGENALYGYKKMFFNQLQAKDIRYIKMRHYAVLAFAKLRHRNICSAIMYGCMAFIVDPIALIKLIKERKKA